MTTAKKYKTTPMSRKRLLEIGIECVRAMTGCRSTRLSGSGATMGPQAKAWLHAHGLTSGSNRTRLIFLGMDVYYGYPIKNLSPEDELRLTALRSKIGGHHEPLV